MRLNRLCLRGHCANLLHHADHVELRPVLGELAFNDSAHVDAVHRDLAPARRDALELALVGSRYRPTARDRAH
jgi:hypothetical protein